MKKTIITSVFTLIILAGLVLGTSQNPDGSCDFLFSLGCIAAVALCGRAWYKMYPEDFKKKEVRNEI